MYLVSYTAFNDANKNGMNICSRSATDLPLMVNCCGNFVANAPFTSENPGGRLDYYLLYIYKGTLFLNVCNEYKVLNEGDFFIIPPNTSYKYQHTEERELDYMYVHFTGSEAKKIITDYGFYTYPQINSISKDGKAAVHFQNIFDAFSRHDRFRDRELCSFLNRLLIYLARSLEGISSTSTLVKSVSYINSHYNINIKIPTLAKIENLSVSRYNTLFRKAFSLSPMEYITKKRMSSACELLSSTDLSIMKISELIGYLDPHFFSRIFKRYIGVSPKEYRKSI